ncbi:uncharacterized protein HMPREF1541_10298 [Cyphellophora europaea CBS 101466]|uniref:Peptide hydrolase n=1 Tax=Cyphellophora europaea (strain CBS 101466) TaxID=1220924 RepID=W2S9B8_CYPE1|nr:uncharacterized protein HMPREF1541_10298 [Cyphellophora europaea CBS 101466]ETN44628.1 hypothetical protein HMPREF1541_10298 [Cyphellophora europaea CBS 101466]
MTRLISHCLTLWSLTATLLVALPLRQRETSALDWIDDEVEFLAELKSHLTGSPNHNKLLERIEAQLQDLGFQTESDIYDFEYYDAPKTPPKLTVDGEDIEPAMYVPYSGVTGPEGVTGDLFKLNNPVAGGPAWEDASGKVAVLNLTTGPADTSKSLAVWPGSPQWGMRGGVPASIANTGVNMTAAAEAGVKAAIYLWDGVTAANVYGQYGPFKMLFQDLPAVYLAGEAASKVVKATEAGATASLQLEGSMVSNTTTRTFWVVVPGTELQNETVIYSTHTDGNNVVQEDGYFALLAQARALAASPPRRTTILLFLTGHLHTPAVTPTGRVLYRWMQDHPELWNGTNGGTTTVFGSCVEHLGAVSWFDDLAHDLYWPTGKPDDEMLFAATPSLANLVQDEWSGAFPDQQLRISNPIESKLEQPGEGLPLLWHQIPEISLVTSPDWLLKEWPDLFDQRQLIDVAVTKRQVASFLRIWDRVDGMDAGQFGDVVYSRGPATLG